MEEEGFMGSENSANDAEGTTNEGGDAYYYYGGDPEVLNSLGLSHLLVLFWTTDVVLKIDEEKRCYFELRNDPKEYQIIGCDEEETRQLLSYSSHFAASTIRSICQEKSNPKGVIDRVFRRAAPEMSPNISYYSEDEYPHRDFALSCGILSSFCFLLFKNGRNYGVMEIVSTHNQDVGALRKLCESMKGLDWDATFRDFLPVQEYAGAEMDHLLEGFIWSHSFQSLNVQEYAGAEMDHLLEGFIWSHSFQLLNVQHDAVPEIILLLDVVCQTFHLPLAQYGILKNSEYTLVHQFSYGDFKNLAPWCQFKDAYLHKRLLIGQGPLAKPYEPLEGFFCRDIAALNITEYSFAHYARECGSIACFTIYLRDLPPLHNNYILEFFLLLPQEIGNCYPHPLLNSIWATIKERLPNYMLQSEKLLGKVLSVKVIKSSSFSEHGSFEIGQHNSSFPHHEGSVQKSSSNSYEQVGETSSSEPESFEIGQHHSSLPHREGLGYTHTLDLFENGTIQRSNSNSYEEAITGEMSSRIPIEASQPGKSKECFEIKGNTVAAEGVSEPVEESTVEDAGYATSNLDVGCATILAALPGMNWKNHLSSRIEPQSLISEPRRSEEILRDEGYPVACGRVDNLVEVSPDEDVGHSSKRLKKTEIPCTAERLKKTKISCTPENIRKHFGKPLKDVAESFGVSVSTFKRRCREVGILRWEGGNSKRIDGEDEPREKNILQACVFCESQELEKMTVKATYNDDMIKFELTNLSGKSDLEDNVIKRLRLKRNSFSIKYQDSDRDWILIGCDEDVQEYMKFSRLAGKTIKMLIHQQGDH